MKSETLVQQHPPTPPNVGVDLHSGLHQVARYVADRSYSFDENQHSGSAYGSPGPAGHEGVPHHSVQAFQSSHVDGHNGSDFGLGIQYDGYGQADAYYQEGQYNGMPNNQAMFSGSPPTPRSATDNDDAARRTRSGRPIVASSPVQSETKSKPKAAPKPKKAKAGKSEKPKTPKLTAPLSILTNDFALIPVRNMEEWVNRSAETRKKEVEKRNGYITRPMNSFMLYRSAYAERTKQWCLQNNHQIVSSVSGESWPLEPPEVRELYNEYAKIERINHQNAHPTYKFSPSKTAVAPRKRKGEFSDDENASDLDDGAWTPGHGRSRMRNSRKPDRSLDRNLSYATNMHPDFVDHRFGPNGNGMNKWSWEMTNEGRPMPMAMGQGDLYNQYYQTTVHPSMNMGPAAMEDMRMRRVDTPGVSMQFSPGHSLLGLPGGNDAAGLMQQMHSHGGTPLGDEPQVDPMLLAFDGGHNHDMDHHVMTQHPEFRNGHMSLMDRELDQDSVHSLLGTAPSHDEFNAANWQLDPSMAPMESGSEFDKWMDDQHRS